MNSFTCEKQDLKINFKFKREPGLRSSVPGFSQGLSCCILDQLERFCRLFLQSQSQSKTLLSV